MSVRLDSLNYVTKGLKTDSAQFNPYLDEYGIIRSNSRLTKLDRGYETKYPVILHRRSDFMKLLVTNLHFHFEHPVSFAAMKASVKKHYMILGLGTLCAQVKASCPQCKKLRAAPMKQQMAPLPERRVNSRMNPFEHVGIDYAGPFELKTTRLHSTKRTLNSQNGTLQLIGRKSQDTQVSTSDQCQQELSGTSTRHSLHTLEEFLK